MHDYQFVVVFFIGFMLHAAVFSSHEWDRRTSSIVTSFFTSHLILSIFLINVDGLSWKPFSVASAYSASLLGGLSSSMIIYRSLLHPLKSFAGPLAARVTSLWIIKQNFPNLNFYVKLRSLHDQYGDFVRISE